MQTEMSYDTLVQIVQSATAIRRRVKLQPAGGTGDKVFPPTYMEGKYAFEDRMIDGQKKLCVILDSVQSQANRMELALLEAARAEKITLPIVQVDFKKKLPDVGIITSLETPHRIADAIFRDSMFDHKTPFPYSDAGQRFICSGAGNATGLFEFCPTALLFGMWWNPTGGPGNKGPLGTRIARAITSEIIGVDAVPGVATGGQSNVLGIAVDASMPLYKSKDKNEIWTFDSSHALKHNDSPSKIGKKGKPSEINHGGVAPDFAYVKDNKGGSIYDENGKPRVKGGVTIAYALQTVVLSLPALRRLCFKNDEEKATLSAQTALAALGLCAAALSCEKGCDLRSRCQLMMDGPSSWEVVKANGDTEPFALDGDTACKLLNNAVGKAKDAKLPWMEKPLTLTPSSKLVELVRKSRNIADEADVGTDGATEG